MRVADLDPDARVALEVGNGRLGAADAIEGAEERVIRWANDAQQGADAGLLAGGVLEPAVALAVVAEPEHLDGDLGEILARGEVEQHRRGVEALDRRAVVFERQDLRPARYLGLEGYRRRAREQHAELLQLVLLVARHAAARFDQAIVLVVEPGKRAGLAHGRRDGPADEGQVQFVQIGEFEDHGVGV